MPENVVCELVIDVIVLYCFLFIFFCERYINTILVLEKPHVNLFFVASKQ